MEGGEDGREIDEKKELRCIMYVPIPYEECKHCICINKENDSQTSVST